MAKQDEDKMENKGFAERIGYGFGRILRAYVKKEVSAIDWLTARGAHRSLTKVVFWVVKLLVLGALLCFALWVALPYFVLVVASALQRRGVIFPERGGGGDRWRHGASGYGDYSGDHRVDAGRFDKDD
jgi:hypothetical protein